MNICEKCKYFSVFTSDPNCGECRKSLPMATAEHKAGYWPCVVLDDWCGEWEEDIK